MALRRGRRGSRRSAAARGSLGRGPGLQRPGLEVEAAPRFPGLVKEEFVFTKAKFPQCHASTICQTTRGLVVAWFGGTKEKNKDVGIWVSYHDGRSWTSPKEWANGVQHDGHRHPCWNPVLFQPRSGPLMLLMATSGSPSLS